MTGGSLGLRTGSYGSLQQQAQNGVLQTQNLFALRKPSKMSLSGSREKERFLPLICRYLGRRKVGMLILAAFALLAFMTGFFTVNKEDASESTSSNIAQRFQDMRPFDNASYSQISSFFPRIEDERKDNSPMPNTVTVCGENSGQPPPTAHTLAAAVATGSADLLGHRCKTFAFPPPPPGDRRRIGPRPCPVCYIPVEQAIASMPSSPSVSPVLRHLTYFREENPIKTEPHGGSDFGGYPSLDQRNDSYNIKESMTVHCGFVKGCRPGHHTGFDIDEADLRELEQFHEVIVASAIFGNYDIIQEPKNVSEIARKNIPFYMFIDEETEAFMKNSSVLDRSKRVGLWRIIVVYNSPYSDARRNGKVPKLLLHRLFPNVRYSIWIDGKLQLVVDPYQILERFLWRQNATFTISRHYRRFDVFEEAEANKAAGKYDNASIDYQIDFYKKEGLTPYSEAKLPITSDVPEGCVIVREHIPITNLFTCLWFNEVDRFTSRDQLSFSTVRDKIMAKVNWSVNMFMDCERRNFVIQAYHRDLLEQMAPPAGAIIHRPPAVIRENTAGRTPVKKNPIRRGRGERRSGSRRHRKVVTGSRDNISV
uniref:TOD1/MUCI70 glycosyltransferase-like domain-containing protein n=1 Tax=Davidia involucrata TaxID=16924 RepID=A0A5B7BDK8_DAVIN